MGGELRVVHDFTDDAAALRARLANVTLGMPLETVTDFTQSVIEAEQLLTALGGMPSRE